MNSKRFEYLSKDMPILKRDIRFRLFFMFLFLAIFVWQFTNFVIDYNNKTLTSLKISLTIAVLIFTLLMSMLSLMYALKSYKILEHVQKDGQCVGSVAILFRTEKDSFLQLYSIVLDILAVTMLLVLASIVTYSLLQYVYYSTISFFMPSLVLLTILGFNSVYHIRNEINTVKTLNEFHAIY